MKPVTAESYSNIALIKYMGKTDTQANLASNPSFSYTLSHLKSVVRVSEVEKNQEARDIWQPLSGPGLMPIDLSEKGQAKFLKHVQRLKDLWGYQGNLVVESANSFPADCGIASSASSFAALTKAVAIFLNRKESDLELARLSRLGSGSSCRSFFGPWCLWNEDNIEAVELPYSKLHHMVVLVDSEKKEVSSSEAHVRVASSPLFAERSKRVHQRMEKLLSCLKHKNWSEAYSVTWDEFEDMHQLFETSQPAFTYRNEKTKEVLEDIKKVWGYKGDGPLVTMDAGANVHLLFREEQEKIYTNMKSYFAQKFRVLGSL